MSKKPETVDTTKKLTDEEAVKLLIHDLALLGRSCRVVIENGTYDGSMLEQAYQALTMCRHVEDRWIKKDEK